MKSLQISIEAVLPLFLLMLTGYVIRITGIVEKSVFNGMNKLVFYIFLPVLLFRNIYNTNFSSAFNGRLILYCVVGILLVFAIGFFIVCLCSKENARRAVMLQGMFRSNVAFLGIPLVNYLCGEKALGTAGVCVTISVVLVNLLAVVCFAYFGNEKPMPKSVIETIVRNPLVVACLLGFICMGLSVKLPGVLERSVSEVAGVATPLAMIVLGAGFSFSDLKGYGKEVVITILAKLVLIPLFFVGSAAVMGFRDVSLACILCTFGTPVAVASFSMAQEMGGDETLASHLVVISSAFCIPTLFLFVFALSYCGLI